MQVPHIGKADAGTALVTDKRLHGVLARRILSGLFDSGDKTYTQAISAGKTNGFTPADTRAIIATLDQFGYIRAYVDKTNRIAVSITEKGAHVVKEVQA